MPTLNSALSVERVDATLQALHNLFVRLKIVPQPEWRIKGNYRCFVKGI